MEDLGSVPHYNKGYPVTIKDLRGLRYYAPTAMPATDVHYACDYIVHHGAYTTEVTVVYACYSLYDLSMDYLTTGRLDAWFGPSDYIEIVNAGRINPDRLPEHIDYFVARE